MDLEKSHSRIFADTEGYHQNLTPQHSLNMEDQLKLHFSVAIETAHSSTNFINKKWFQVNPRKRIVQEKSLRQ